MGGLSTGAATLAPTDSEVRWDRVSGAIASALAALIPIATSPIAQSQSFAPKYALVLLLTVAGTVPLVPLAYSSRYAWIARAGLAFVGISVVSALLSPSRLVGFFGLYLWGEGVLFLLALVAAWALGVSLGPQGRSWLVSGLLVGVTANAVAAIVQTTFHLSTQTADLSGFGLYGGTQADGMMGNPIHLEAIVLGGLALLLGRTCRRPWPNVLVPATAVALFAAALECSSERYGVLLLLPLVAYAAWTYRKGSAPYLGAVVIGFVGTFLSGAGASLSTRIATSTAATTFGLRLHAWAQGAAATIEHRPLFGFGPGEVRNALTLYQSRAFAASVPPGKYFTDLHDLFVNILVMTGIIGFVLFCGFLLATTWKVRGALAGFAALALAVELVEPMNLGVTPLAFLALGAALAASRGSPWKERDPRSGPRLSVILIVLPALALLPAGVLVAGDIAEHAALQHFSLPEARLANTLVPIWPESADGIAEIYAYDSVTNLADRHDLRSARNWQAVAVSRDPADNEGWVVLATADLQLGDLSSARHDAERALADDPYSVDALSVIGRVAARSRDWRTALDTFRLALSIGPKDATTEGYLAAAEQHDAAYFG